MSAKVISVNISEKKGTTKRPVARISVTKRGIENDAHAGQWHRQVSLLAWERVKAFSAEMGKKLGPGDFAENITTEGIDLVQVAIRDRFKIGGTDLEVTQIGKECHGAGCSIFQETGKCVMPKEGIFTRVLKGGEIKPGDGIEHTPRPLRILVVTLSDRASKGEYEDKSGPAIRECLNEHFLSSRFKADISSNLIPDDAKTLRSVLEKAICVATPRRFGASRRMRTSGATTSAQECVMSQRNDPNEGFDIIFTTGGTGIGPRDITPEVVKLLLDKEIPGIMEFIRVKHGEKIPSALLSRSIAGVAGKTLIFALPGSVKAVRQYMEEILKTLDHSLLMLAGIDAH